MRDYAKLLLDAVREDLRQGDSSANVDFFEQRLRESVTGEMRDDFLDLLAYIYVILKKADAGELNPTIAERIRSELRPIRKKYNVSDNIEKGVQMGEDLWKNGPIGNA